MFTGIIEDLGQIESVKPQAVGLKVMCRTTLISQIKLGDSIAIDGACSTVTKIIGPSFEVEYSEETLLKTKFKNLKPGQKVNLELSLTPLSRIGGHFVTGHVDEVGHILKLEKQQDFALLEVGFGADFRHLLVPKGSVAVDGLSLTVADLTADRFTCHIIPHTLKNTTLSEKKSKGPVHLEYDILGKYLFSFYNRENFDVNKTENSAKDNNLMNLLNKSGFIK
jgi:riboflavin synthase